MAEVLVVDDEAYMRRMIRRMLEGAGHAVQEATGGDEALALLRGAEVDLVVTDLMMSTGRGIQLITSCRKEFPNLPVIAMSARSQFLDVAEQLGAKTTLGKPFNKKQLLSAIALSLDLPG